MELHNQNISTKVKPLFRYIGGKTWMKQQLRENIEYCLKNNPRINNYVEPFCGGLGAFFAVYDLLLKYNIKNVLLNDININVINCYKTILLNDKQLVEEYLKIENKFLSLSTKNELEEINKVKQIKNYKEKKEEFKKILVKHNDFYKNVRKKFNNKKKKTDSIINTARLLFLQNHCFNGIYRENSKGGYNTPFNWEYKKAIKENVVEKIENIRNVFLQFNITFESKTYKDLSFEKEALLYLDPPYLNDSIVENKYHKLQFTIDDQCGLIEKIKFNTFLYSNHKCNALLDIFRRLCLKHLTIREVQRKNIISSSSESRKKDKIEILVRHVK